MPQKIFCKECKYVLYSGSDVRPPSEVAIEYDSTCPNCGRKLSSEIEELRILSFVEQK